MAINKKIVLLGYMGSGKSTIAKLLSKKLDIMNVDLDNYIEKKENKSISNIFYGFKKNHFGWLYGMW